MPITSASASASASSHLQTISPGYFKSQNICEFKYSPNKPDSKPDSYEAYPYIDPSVSDYLAGRLDIPQEVLKTSTPEGIAKLLSCFHPLLCVGNQASPKEEKDAIDPRMRLLGTFLTQLTTEIPRAVCKPINNRSLKDYFIDKNYSKEVVWDKKNNDISLFAGDVPDYQQSESLGTLKIQRSERADRQNGDYDLVFIPTGEHKGTVIVDTKTIERIKEYAFCQEKVMNNDAPKPQRRSGEFSLFLGDSSLSLEVENEDEDDAHKTRRHSGDFV